jgi:hydroxyacylglutathione hydrolase
MLFLKQYYLNCLSHASYLVGDRSTGRAVVVDPQRDVQQYLDDATRAGLTIERVIETHIHADFVSGHQEIAASTGCAISYGEVAARSLGFAIEPLQDGQLLSLGAVELKVLATPGHTPESICLLVTDAPGKPGAVLTGDTLFIGDVGRPDLLSGPEGSTTSADTLARLLYASLRDVLLKLPDETLVYPAHGAGSSCGKNLSSETVSTIGEQRRSNYALQEMTEDAFVDVVTTGQAVPPGYFAHAVAHNKMAGAQSARVAVPELSMLEALAARQLGAVLLDVRSPALFAVGHVPGSINVGLEGRFAEYVGQVIPGSKSLVVVASPGDSAEAVMRLARIGFDDVFGAIEGPAANYLQPCQRYDAAQLVRELTRSHKAEVPQLLDVRSASEFASGHIVGAVNIPLSELNQRVGEVFLNGPVVVYCAGGYRSSIAASLLRARGIGSVVDLIGGFAAWSEASNSTASPNSLATQIANLTINPEKTTSCSA